MKHTKYKKLANYKTFFIIIFIGIIFSILILYRNQTVENNKPENLPQFANTLNPVINDKQIWGDPVKDMFPDITNPQYVSAENADTFLKDSDIVYFIQAKDNTYVYPQLIFRHHEVVNDTIDGRPLAITFCILSNTPLIYNRVVDNQTLSFRSLGPLMYGNQIMFDKETDSYWNEITGVAFKGKLTGKRLAIAQPIEKTTWDKMKFFSNLKVLYPVLGIDFYHQNEQRNNPQARLGIGLTSMKEQKPDPGLAPGTSGLGIVIHNSAQFYPEETIKQQVMITDTVGGWSLLILNNDNLGDQKIYRTYVNGQELHFFVDGKNLLDRETRSSWDVSGTAISGTLKGTKLVSPAYVPSYWYSWAAFYPGTAFYTASTN